MGKEGRRVGRGGGSLYRSVNRGKVTNIFICLYDETKISLSLNKIYLCHARWAPSVSDIMTRVITSRSFISEFIE